MQEETISIRKVLEKYSDWNILFYEVNDFGIEFILTLEFKGRVRKVHNLMFDFKNQTLKILKKNFSVGESHQYPTNFQEVK